MVQFGEDIVAVNDLDKAERGAPDTKTKEEAFPMSLCKHKMRG